MTEAAEDTEVVAKLSSIGKYRLIASLGQGGMAKVYLALMAGPAGFNKLLVIKALREDMMASGEEFIAMFLDEARLAARLNHPNVVQTYEVGEAGGRYFIAMEYLEGQALRTVQRRLDPDGLPLEEEMRTIAETARGLHYAHELKGFDGEPLNVVHRDVSPQNVFLTYDGQVKLLDFGIAKQQDAEHMTKVGVIKGKVDYIAPEQIRGEDIDRRADVFALGAMMWEGLSGHRFGGGPKVQDVTKIHNRVTGGEPNLAELKPELPEELVRICNKSIALDPDDRHATAEDLANDIDAYLATTANRPSAKTLADLLAPSFESERGKLRKLIDKQIQICRTTSSSAGLDGSTGGLPSMALAGTSTGSGVRTSSYSGVGSLPDLSELTAGSGSVAQAEPQKKGVPKGLTALIVAAAVGAAAYLGGQEEPPAPVQTPAPAAASKTPEIAPAPAPNKQRGVDTVRVRVSVEPADAHVTLDGAQLPKLPFEADLARDGKLHVVEASAPGFANLKQVLTFDRDRELSFVLKAKATEPQRRRRGRNYDTAPAAPAEATQAATAPTAPPAAKPGSQDVAGPGKDLVRSGKRRTPASPRIDLEDPYQ